MEESFGPVVGIMKVKDDDEAIAPDERLALRADRLDLDQRHGRGRARSAREIETGTVYMNRCDYLDPGLAWTGVKDTGRGASLSRLGYEMLTRPKSYHLQGSVIDGACAATGTIRPRVRFGAGRIARARRRRQGRRHARPLLVTDPARRHADRSSARCDVLAGDGVPAVVFSDVKPNPVAANVEAGLQALSARRARRRGRLRRRLGARCRQGHRLHGRARRGRCGTSRTSATGGPAPIRRASCRSSPCRPRPAPARRSAAPASSPTRRRTPRR